jgi:hypothetical protein
MNPTRAAVLAAFALATAMGTASAETLLVERVQEETAVALPARGLSMAEVQSRFGAPASRLEPRGGQKPQWPVIHRWTYPAFVVYFEKDKVIDAVLVQDGPGEVGPKPPIR